MEPSMPRRKYISYLIVFGMLFFIKNGQAAEITCSLAWDGSWKWIDPVSNKDITWTGEKEPPLGTCLTLELKGQIQKGDFDKFFDIYRNSHPFLNQIRLESPGGDVVEAISIGRILRKYLISAHAGNYCLRFKAPNGNLPCPAKEDQLCASACALIWIGAPQRSGRVGVHRPHITDSEFKDLPYSEAQKVYSEAITLVTKYLEEMEAPREFIELNTVTSSQDIRWIEKGDKYFVSPSFAEWIIASCGNILNGQEKSKLYELEDIQKDERTDTENILIKLFDEKRERKRLCEKNLIFHSRQQMGLSKQAQSECGTEECVRRKNGSRLTPSAN
jgi:hypothetical protein